MPYHHYHADSCALIWLSAGVYTFYKGFQDLWLERLLAGTAQSKARSAAAGAVELSGRAKAAAPDLRDPIFGQGCCFYDISVSQANGSSRNAHWAVIDRNVSAPPFYLEDDTGSIPVAPAGVRYLMKKSIDWTLDLAFYNEVGSRTPTHVYARKVCPSGSVKVEAYIVREGQPLFVFGYAGLPETAAAGAPALIVRKGREVPFIISDEPIKSFTSRLRWQSALMILVGPMLTIMSAAYLAHSLFALW